MVLPEVFISRTKALLGEEWDAFEKALNAESPISIRFNPKKTESGHGEETVPWASHAYYLSTRPSFTLDPLFHAGYYYVQEASSMYLESIIKKYVEESVKCLDLCAAPGGKSTQLLSVLPEGSLLVANEVIRSRSYILSENITKWGNPYSVVTNNDPVAFGKLSGFFDVIVADAPCSGEGMFRKDPGAISEWSVRNVQLCAERQRRIIADVWPALKEGGLLIYSTCTYNREENEENIAWICNDLGAEMLDQAHRFLPHKIKGEGFFIAIVRKTEEAAFTLKNKEKKGQNRGNNKDKLPEELNLWLKNPQDFVIVKENDLYRAIPSDQRENYRLLNDSLKVVSAGITLSELKGKDLIPAHALAMSICLSAKAFPTLELEKEAALQYLRKEALVLPSDIPKGYILITYQGAPLGFVKNIGNRANNLYPQEWRIRMSLKT